MNSDAVVAWMDGDSQTVLTDRWLSKKSGTGVANDRINNVKLIKSSHENGIFTFTFSRKLDTKVNRISLLLFRKKVTSKKHVSIEEYCITN